MNLVFVTLACILGAQIASATLYGGYVHYRPSDTRQGWIDVDYTMYLKPGSTAYNLCLNSTEDDLVNTGYNLYLWSSQPTPQQTGVRHKMNLKANCVQQTDLYFIAEYKGLEIPAPDTSFIGFTSSDMDSGIPVFTEVTYVTNTNTGELNQSPQFGRKPWFREQDGEFVINVRDDDDDLISCYKYSAAQQEELTNCHVKAQEGTHTYSILIKDYSIVEQKNDTRKSFYTTSLFQFRANIEHKGEQKDYLKSELQCDHEKFTYTFKPTNVKIQKITLHHDFCKLRYNRNTDEYKLTSAYTLCGTVVHEEKDHIVFKNVAQVYYINETTSTEMITRVKTLNIGLECRLKKSSVQTLKGVKDESEGIIVGAQYIEINDYAYGNGSFNIDFQVYKSLRYNETYGSEEFPIHVSLEHRIYFELGLNKKNLKIVPQSCYATKTRDYKAETKYHIIQERCP